MEKIKHLGKIPTTCDHIDQSEVQDFILTIASASRSVCEYLCSTAVKGLLAYATTRFCSLSFPCTSIAPSPTGLASTMTSVFFCGSKYDITLLIVKLFAIVLIASWCSCSHFHGTPFLASSRNCFAMVEKSLMNLAQ